MFIAELNHPMFDMFDMSSLRTGIMVHSGVWGTLGRIVKRGKSISRKEKRALILAGCMPVSYTHLDVYKRQTEHIDDLLADLDQALAGI